MEKTFTIDSIWIEFEFHLEYHRGAIMEEMVDYANEWNEKNPKFTIEVDWEYYDDQIELKLRKTEFKEEGIEYFRNFLASCYNKFGWLSATSWKHFVGTHIHMFIKKDLQPYNEFANGKKLLLVQKSYSLATALLNSIPINKRSLSNESNRLCRNHNILRYFDSSIWDVLRKSLEAYRLNYQQFHTWTDKPKYTPVLWSLENPTTWKPHSLEIRCIPNSVFLLSKVDELSLFYTNVEGILNGEIVSTEEACIEFMTNSHIENIKNYLRG